MLGLKSPKFRINKIRINNFREKERKINDCFINNSSRHIRIRIPTFGFMKFGSKQMVEGFKHYGYPGWFLEYLQD